MVYSNTYIWRSFTLPMMKLPASLDNSKTSPARSCLISKFWDHVGAVSFPGLLRDTVWILLTKESDKSTVPEGNIPGAMQSTRIPCGISLTFVSKEDQKIYTEGEVVRWWTALIVGGYENEDACALEAWYAKPSVGDAPEAEFWLWDDHRWCIHRSANGSTNYLRIPN